MQNSAATLTLPRCRASGRCSRWQLRQDRASTWASWAARPGSWNLAGGVAVVLPVQRAPWQRRQADSCTPPNGVWQVSQRSSIWWWPDEVGPGSSSFRWVLRWTASRNSSTGAATSATARARGRTRHSEGSSERTQRQHRAGLRSSRPPERGPASGPGRATAAAGAGVAAPGAPPPAGAALAASPAPARPRPAVNASVATDRAPFRPWPTRPLLWTRTPASSDAPTRPWISRHRLPLPGSRAPSLRRSGSSMAISARPTSPNPVICWARGSRSRKSQASGSQRARSPGASAASGQRRQQQGDQRHRPQPAHRAHHRRGLLPLQHGHRPPACSCRSPSRPGSGRPRRPPSGSRRRWPSAPTAG